MTSKQKRTIIIKGFISLCFLIFFVKFLRHNELLALFRNVNWYYLLLSFLLLPLMLFLSCLKWRILFVAGNSPISFRKLLSFYFIGYFFSSLLPSSVGGDVVRTYYSGKEINSLSFAAVTVFIERLTGLLFLLLFVCIGPLFHRDITANIYFLIPSVCSFVILICILLLFFFHPSEKKREIFTNAVLALLSRLQEKTEIGLLNRTLQKISELLVAFINKIEVFLKALEEAITVLHDKRGYLFTIICLTVLFYLLTWLNVSVAFLTFNKHIGFTIIIALVPTVLFVGQFPLTILGNFGFYESVFVFYFLFAGIPGEITLAMSLLLRLKTLSLGIVGFIIYTFFNKARGSFNKTESRQYISAD